MLIGLEKSGRTAPDGEQWIYKVQAKLNAVGHPVSQGHMYKVRRAFEFLSSGMELLEIDEANAINAKISSIEIAERLYQRDAREGLDALAACLDQKHPATAAEIKKRYDIFVEQHPEKKTAMDAAWDQRKKGDDPKTKSNRKVKDASVDILSDLQVYLSSLQNEAVSKDAHIRDLEEELAETKRMLAQVEYELTIVSDDLKDLSMKSSRS